MEHSHPYPSRVTAPLLGHRRSGSISIALMKKKAVVVAEYLTVDETQVRTVDRCFKTARIPYLPLAVSSRPGPSRKEHYNQDDTHTPTADVVLTPWHA